MKCAIISRKEATLYEKPIKLSAENVKFLSRLYKIPDFATVYSYTKIISDSYLQKFDIYSFIEVATLNMLECVIVLVS